MTCSLHKPTVVHFIRKNRVGGNFSLEFIFEDVRKRLEKRFDFKVVICKRFSNGISNRLLNILDARKEQADINHVTGDIHYINLLFKTKNTILTILDCGFMTTGHKWKRFFLKLFWLTIPVWKSKYITAISEATKADIIKYTGCRSEKVICIPVAVPEIFKPAPSDFNSAYPTLLQLGTAVNKNIERLAEAIENIPCKLVVIGKLNDNHLAHLKDRKIDYENYVNLPLEEIYQHYKACDIVTFVSTYEGFGMPIIEANCVERPVIAGNNTSMPEVGGNAAYYVDAFSVDEIRKGIQKLIRDESLRISLIENGRKNRLRFSNQTIADMYAEVYQRILDQHAN